MNYNLSDTQEYCPDTVRCVPSGELLYSLTLVENNIFSTPADFASELEARNAIDNLDSYFNPNYFNDAEFIILEGPNCYQVIQRTL